VSAVRFCPWPPFSPLHNCMSRGVRVASWESARAFSDSLLDTTRRHRSYGSRDDCLQYASVTAVVGREESPRLNAAEFRRDMYPAPALAARARKTQNSAESRDDSRTRSHPSHSLFCRLSN